MLPVACAVSATECPGEMHEMMPRPAEKGGGHRQSSPQTAAEAGGSRTELHHVRDKYRRERERERERERKRWGTGRGMPCLQEVLNTGQSPFPSSVLSAADRSCSAAMIPRSEVTEPYMAPPTLCDDGTDVMSWASSPRPSFISREGGGREGEGFEHLRLSPLFGATFWGGC